jgi:predicted enzyme related to lactoylglutathione lyase
MPAQWMVYVTVESVETSAKRCVERGGKIVDGPRLTGNQAFCVIRDPAGAVLGLIEE